MAILSKILLFVVKIVLKKPFVKFDAFSKRNGSFIYYSSKKKHSEEKVLKLINTMDLMYIRNE